MQEFQPDWIVAMGGGCRSMRRRACGSIRASRVLVRDMCKSSAAEASHQGALCRHLLDFRHGDGGDAFSIITDYAKGVKFPIADFEITPDIAIVDPELTLTMPQKLCAHTGMDALTHDLEAIVAVAHSPYSDALAIHSMKMIRDSLVKSFGGDAAARAVIHDAQCLAGMSFSKRPPRHAIRSRTRRARP